MKFSKETLTILNNFSHINENILLKEGSNLRTKNESSSIYGEANLNDSFPMDFGISDLNNFLNTYNIFNDPELTFSENKVSIKEGNAEYNYHRASERVLTYPPYDKNIQFREAKATFTLDRDQLKNIIKAANAIKNLASSKESCVHFYCKDGDIIVESKLMKDEPMKNTYKINLGNDWEIKEEFDIVIDASKINLVDGDYEVSVYDKFIRVKNTQIDLFYVITSEIL